MKRRDVSAIVIYLTALSGCTLFQSPNEKLGVSAEKAVADTLKDPTSAKFKDVIASTKANCIYGKLLAKNSAGAYTGYHDFVWINDHTAIDNTADLKDVLPTEAMESTADYVQSLQRCQLKSLGIKGDETAHLVDT